MWFAVGCFMSHLACDVVCDLFSFSCVFLFVLGLHVCVCVYVCVCVCVCVCVSGRPIASVRGQRYFDAGCVVD